LDDDFAGDGFYARAADGDPPGSGEGGTSGGPRANEGEPFAGGGEGRAPAETAPPERTQAKEHTPPPPPPVAKKKKKGWFG